MNKTYRFLGRNGRTTMHSFRLVATMNVKTGGR